ncbi:sulfurtransferase complex subunit TusD [Psychrobacter sp. I-STPA10]|uniref:sulfurtransferase complex subunit TusD n=1 Tax=Psychrobacter sp. I-STPA10 TaxID=2585769 RepID=UPI001E546E57|nr:sulfurtransferase complex subunit TusD [Psychrobacter sp. I-STPA10]
MSTKPCLLLLISKSPTHPLAQHALRYARSYLQLQANANSHKTEAVSTMPTTMPKLAIFFYADAAHIANRLHWQSADQSNLTEQWQQLQQNFSIELPVCVSTALARGVADTDNAQRHGLQGDNLAEGFSLVGLGDLADKMHRADKVIQF